MAVIYFSTSFRSLTWYREASGKRISGVTRLATTYGTVVYHLASSVKAARAWARVNTLLIHASFILGTFGAHDTLRSASRGTSGIVRKARTNSLSVYFAALTVRTTRARLAWILRFFFDC